MESSIVLPYRPYNDDPSKRYQYSTLSNSNAIRLLVIEPGTTQSEIRCSIVENSLADLPMYEALSYTWGDPTENQGIQIGSKRIGVTTNLYSAIRSLRWPDFRRTLWIDAICINQKNVVEKTQQVRRMKDIYAQAAAVLIWLGEEYHTDWRVFRLIEEFNEEKGCALPEVAIFTSRLSAEDASLKNAVARLLQRPWFRRVWVIQEVAMARKARLICGTQKTDWSALVRLIQFVQQNGLESYLSTTVYVGMLVSMMETIRNARRTQSTEGFGLVELLEKTQISSATDTRDSVFALLGIAADGASTGLGIDYSLECGELFQRLAIYKLGVQQSLSYLSFAGLQPLSRTPNLPYWVPDWSINANPAPRSSLAGQGFNTSADTKPNISISPNGRELTASGYVVERVDRVGTIPVTLERSEPFTENNSALFLEAVKEKAALEECDEISNIAKPTYPTGESLASIYWRIVICNRLVSGAVPEPEMAEAEPILQYIASHADDIINRRPYKFDLNILRHLYKAYQYGSALGKWASGRVFCATESHHLGWLPRGAKKGDFICILEGGEVPFVMRSADGRYKVLGDCYIHGIMDGEAMKREGLVKEKFCLI